MQSLNYFVEANASPPTRPECPSIISARNAGHSMRAFPAFVLITGDAAE